jgi:phosphopantothenoylcysteine synthetase/decarboxylase
MQAVHDLLLAGSFNSNSNQQQQQQHQQQQQQQHAPALQPLQLLALQLPISGVCYKRLQPSCSRFAELLQLDQLLVASSGPAAAAAAAAAAAGRGGGRADVHMSEINDNASAVQADASTKEELVTSHDVTEKPHSSSSMLTQLQYRLDSVMSEALGDSRLMALLSQEMDCYIQDLLLLSLADLTEHRVEAAPSSSSSSSGSSSNVRCSRLSLSYAIASRSDRHVSAQSSALASRSKPKTSCGWLQQYVCAVGNQN